MADREPVFTSVGAAFVMDKALAGVASQSRIDLSDTLDTRLGAEQRGGTTAMRVWIAGLWTTGAVVTTPVIAEYAMGVGMFSAGMDGGDFPDLEAHKGPWMLHDLRRLQDINDGTPVVQILTPAGVPHGGLVWETTRSKRKAERFDDRLFMVVQRDRVTEEDTTLMVSVSVMWLLP